MQNFSDEAAAWFDQMFSTPLDSMTDEQWYAKFGCYKQNADLQLRLWWPPLSELWRVQGEMPPNYPSPETWQAAWDWLCGVHADWLQARQMEGVNDG